MAIAFVLSGGGSLGAVQVGMLQALAEHNVHPDLLIGTSVGAVNAAYLAGHGSGWHALADLARLWRSMCREDVFAFNPLHHVLAATGARPSLYSARNLRRLIEANLTFRQLEGAEIPVHLVATDLLSGCEVLMSTGEAASAVLASAAIPGVLPPVVRDGRTLIDGAASDNTPLSQAVALGADEIYILPTGYACLLPRAPRTALGTAMHALTLLIEQRLIEDVAGFAGPGRLAVLPPLCPLGISSTDFGHADELIQRAHRATARWLESGGPALPAPERFLSLHTHRPPGAPLTVQQDLSGCRSKHT